MDDRSNIERAIELLQRLGLKEYEARSFVALTRRENGTAKEISETSAVPRTRVYDAVRVLESKGLVETQHSKPQVFRAVSIDEAVTTLQNEYIERAQTLRTVLSDLEPTDDADSQEVTHEVWALAGDRGISTRTRQLIDGATEEVVVIVGHPSVFTDELREHLQTAHDRGVNVLVGTVSAELAATIEAALPDVEVFVSDLAWLQDSAFTDDETAISRLLLTDREAILVSSFAGGGDGERHHERAVFGRGFDNGLVAIVRRLMATGLLLDDDPRSSTPGESADASG